MSIFNVTFFVIKRSIEKELMKKTILASVPNHNLSKSVYREWISSS
jgi:hypothetical protein